MNRYYVVSGGLHVLLAGFLLLSIAPAAKKPIATYTIDFLGQSFQGPVTAPQDEVGPKAEDASKAEVKETPKEEAKPITPPPADKKAYAAKQEITKKPAPAKPKKIVLGTPSILAETENKKAEAKPADAAKTGAGSGGPGGGIKTDFSNFPYPWYITQVRNSLWTEWEKRKPKNAVLACSVSFAIQANGSITDVKVVSESGNAGYDYSAKSSVEGAAPFPPLPKDFGKDTLTVTVEFKDEA
ncbi:protein TonB [Elusimicrobium simillimum]|uniref:energy transducer TonB n=1 Tax=Elusimicrobium simillimum TaxID=3143438 RepID=UPI003C7002F1